MREYLFYVCKYFIYIYIYIYIYISNHVSYMYSVCMCLLYCACFVWCVWCLYCVCVYVYMLQVQLINKRRISKSRSAEILTYTTGITFNEFNAAESMLFALSLILNLTD